MDASKEKYIQSPLGIMPRKFWLERRIREVSAAIERYRGHYRAVPDKFYAECIQKWEIEISELEQEYHRVVTLKK